MTPDMEDSDSDYLFVIDDDGRKKYSQQLQESEDQQIDRLRREESLVKGQGTQHAYRWFWHERRWTRLLSCLEQLGEGWGTMAMVKSSVRWCIIYGIQLQIKKNDERIASSSNESNVIQEQYWKRLKEKPKSLSEQRLAWLREPTGAVAKASLHRAIVTAYGPEPGWSIHDQDEAWAKLSGGPNRLMLKNQRMSCG
ncbi:hypothetical protein CQW23_30056 [Capsicum baccatum]|uniref:Uncharacterized protein n=1 Tax=Capsicum baccatum TaxID=33114 RepID=A0A2G2VBK2_CAPBA|nr:hypothetical protein CQW23_30056 [Capsicum baccatum]